MTRGYGDVVQSGCEDREAPPAGAAMVRSRSEIAEVCAPAARARRRAAEKSLDSDAAPGERLAAARDAEFLEGVMLTLAWARGDRAEAPITRAQPAQVTARALQHERVYAQDAIEQGHDEWAADWLPSRWYGEGVRQAISWLLGDESVPPLARPVQTGEPQ